MDADRFDALARNLTVTGSRRRALTTALGSTLALTGLIATDDSMAGGGKPKCPECKKCKCKTTRHGKKCKCKPKPVGTPCGIGTCQSGSCVATATAPPPPPPFCEASRSTLCNPTPGASFECSSDPTKSCVCMLTESGSRVCVDLRTFHEELFCEQCEQEGAICVQYNQPGTTGCAGSEFGCASACPTPRP
jgi:hypothetical protein